MIDPGNEMDPIKIAQMELDQNKLPFIVVRNLPDGKTEYWKIQELEKLSR
jgi:DNA-directed RNA polymerase I, II, and III subunit RPABC2